jgi:hypothetical protein
MRKKMHVAIESMMTLFESIRVEDNAEAIVNANKMMDANKATNSSHTLPFLLDRRMHSIFGRFPGVVFFVVVLTLGFFTHKKT